MPTECANSKQCAPAKHHYDECVERVTKQQDEGGAKEDCVEECEYRQGPRGPEPATTALSGPPTGPDRGGWNEADPDVLPSQSSTSPTAPPNALLPSCGPSSNKRRHPPDSGTRHGGIDLVGAACRRRWAAARPSAIAVAAGLAYWHRLHGRWVTRHGPGRRSGKPGIAVGCTPTWPSTACALYHTLHATLITRFPFLLHRPSPVG